MGLYWETEGHSLNTDPGLLYEHRRLWYSAYHFDPVLGITLGRPFGITDEIVRVPLPNPWAASHRPLTQDTNDFDIHHQRAHNHLFIVIKLESEIKHVQQNQTWPLKDSQPQAKFRNVSKTSNHVCRSGTVLFQAPVEPTHRPYSRIRRTGIPSIITLSYQYQTTGDLSVSYEAASKLIASIKILQREGKLDVLWRSVHHLFMAGLTIIYALWQSKEIRDRNPIGGSVSTPQSCASTLSAMSKTFHGAAGCRDVFDTLSLVTVDWLVTNDAEETRQNRVAFEQQVEELLLQLQPSRGGVSTNENSANEMSTMLSTDNFAFGEMLNYAAQWPDFPDMELNNMGPEFMTGAGFQSGPYTFL